MLRYLAAMALLLAPALSGAQTGGLDPRNWGAEHSALTAGPQFAKSKAICRRLGDPDPPAADRPTSAEIAALKGCSSEKLYYGEGMTPDFRKARLCAFIEVAGADDQVFGGSTILMQVYANGLGVSRNPDLATAYACRIEGAAAESDGRVLHMQALKTKPEHVDYCDDITSGLAQGYCQSRASAKAAVGRDARLKALQAGLSPSARPLYAPMKAAFDAFVDAHVRGEVDLSGTARAAEEFQEEDKVRDQFEKDLRRLLAGQWAAGSAQDAKAADAQLNASYRKALASAAGKDNFSTVKADDIRKAERAWLAYRDAFHPFAAAAAPNVNPDAVGTRLTKLRTAQLDDLAR
jgi:uncharacterized protein YecT (DUF1311 family)